MLYITIAVILGNAQLELHSEHLCHRVVYVIYNYVSHIR